MSEIEPQPDGDAAPGASAADAAFVTGTSAEQPHEPAAGQQRAEQPHEPAAGQQRAEVTPAAGQQRAEVTPAAGQQRAEVTPAAGQQSTEEPQAALASSSPVAAALVELETLRERDLDEHPDVYQRIHAELQSALGAIDDA